MSDNVSVLGFDTSGAHCGAAYFSGGDVVSAAYEDMKRGQAERLPEMIAEVMEAADADIGQLSAIGVGVGPGNFTGIRISISYARGLAMALGIPAVGVDLFDALALGQDRDMVLCLKAPRDSFYIQIRAGAEVSDITTWTPGNDLTFPSGAICLGENADILANELGIERMPAKYAPASAIARIAAHRFRDTVDRPKPLYLRPADAAPSSTPAPTIIT